MGCEFTDKVDQIKNEIEYTIYIEKKDKNKEINLIGIMPDQYKSRLIIYINKVNSLLYINDKIIKDIREYRYKFRRVGEYKIKIELRDKLKTAEFLFCECNKIIQFNLDNLITDEIENMHGMFCGCKKIEQLNLNSFNTKKVKNMGAMFWYCENLIELKIDNFNTENVTNMGYMFCECYRIVVLDLKNFDTKNVIYEEDMFNNCKGLYDLKIDSFNTDKIRNMNRMLKGLDNLKYLTVNKTFYEHEKFKTAELDEEKIKNTIK